VENPRAYIFYSTFWVGFAYSIVSGFPVGGAVMELSFSELRAKEVVNTQDGRKLGRTCDLVFCYPENRVIGLVVPDNKSFFKKEERFIAMREIVRIGEDVILVNLPSDSPKGCPPKGKCSSGKADRSAVMGWAFGRHRDQSKASMLK
jgi:YlmC/YmxH family sporulation protein